MEYFTVTFPFQKQGSIWEVIRTFSIIQANQSEGNYFFFF